jgi:dihydroorotate dehydrogenase
MSKYLSNRVDLLNIIYDLSRPFLFSLPPESAHQLSLAFSKFLPNNNVLAAPVDTLGLHFLNPIGLAAGFDKDGKHLFGLAKFGFGFIEIGTLTPRPQPGNNKPRLFRLPENQAIINRMGFNNQGIMSAVKHLNAKNRPNVILGINLGKNKDTPLAEALADYQFGLEQAYLSADYFAINISSPNTVSLRELQVGDHLHNLLSGIAQTREVLIEKFAVKKRLLLKIAPDLSLEALENISNLVLKYQWDGIIATNTTVERNALSPEKHAQQSGGLSGKPLFEKSTEVLRKLRSQLPEKFPIIAAGGIFSAADAQAKLTAGATLLQLYTGFIYQGPRLIQAIANDLQQKSASLLS